MGKTKLPVLNLAIIAVYLLSSPQPHNLFRREHNRRELWPGRRNRPDQVYWPNRAGCRVANRARDLVVAKQPALDVPAK